MNIEKLAIEHAVHVGTENGYTEYLFDDSTLEAFAKALQSSEPVAEVGTYIGDADDAHGIFSYQVFNGSPLISGESKLFTNPPASVPLEKYNKLLEAYKSAIQSIDDYDCYDRETGKPYFKHEIFKWDLEFISEIEAKNEQSINSN